MQRTALQKRKYGDIIIEEQSLHREEVRAERMGQQNAEHFQGKRDKR